MGGHGHGHQHHHHSDEPHTHGTSVFEFLASIFAFSLDETLLYNVCDPQFWKDMRPRLENEFTHDALDHLEEAAAILVDIPVDMRKMTLDAEYGQAFLGATALMPPIESAYGLSNGNVREIARELGVEDRILDILPADHIANELFMLVPLDGRGDPTPEQLMTLASFFEWHPITLLQHMLGHSEPAEDGTGFYRAITEFALGWLKWDLDAFNQ